ncbi:MAG TPA: hypothetical protein VMP68_28020 [Candidatus Eisenbacteria bacterium]|nr:hypothetical protein [Candidatus Eisenbacteria bacterium]
MSRHSSLMGVSLVTCLLVSATTLAESANSTAPSPVEVLYLFSRSTPETYDIQTYDVDPSYGDSTMAGTVSVNVPSNSYCSLVPRADDHYVYLFCAYGTGGTVLQVYATDSSGVPQDSPIQTVKLKTAVFPFLIDPNGTLAYAAEPLQQRSTVPTLPRFGIWAFALDAKTGMATGPPTLSSITSPPLDGLCNIDNYFADPSFSLIGFNLDGTQLIDAWGCDGKDDSVDYYYTQTVNQKNGALGPPVATVGDWSSFEEYSRVTFTPAAILSFENQGDEGAANELDVYWSNAKLNFSCTYTMLDACSFSSGITTDRTGLFIFFSTYTGGIEVTRLNMNKKEIEPVGIPLSDPIETFSVDDRLIYSSPTLSWNGDYVIPVYVFDPGTGLVTNNGAGITLPSEGYSLIPALRY